MRSFLGLIAALAAALAVLALSASQALADHVQCGDVITQDTTLDSDLTDCPGDGLVVSGSDLTLDLGGHTVRGGDPGGAVGIDTGIELDGSRITVQDGRVEDFAFDLTLGSSPLDHQTLSSSEDLLRRLQIADSREGVFVGSGSRNRIEGNQFVNCGMYLAGGSHALIQRNTFDKGDRQPDLFMEEAGGSVVRENVGRWLDVANGREGLTVEGNRFEQVEIDNSRRARVVGNSAREMSLYIGDSVVERNVLRGAGMGIFGNHSSITKNTLIGGGIGLLAASNNRVEGNSIRGGGIGLEDFADHNLVVNNSITGSAAVGIALNASYQHSGTTGNVIERNLVSGSGGNGVLLKSFYFHGTLADHQTDTVLRDNVIRDNALDGVAVEEGSTGTLVEGNRVLRNGDDGLDVKDPSSSIFGNRTWFNGDLGIEAAASITGSGNWAKHNGNPAQCVPDYLCSTSGRP